MTSGGSKCVHPTAGFVPKRRQRGCGMEGSSVILPYSARVYVSNYQ